MKIQTLRQPNTSCTATGYLTIILINDDTYIDIANFGTMDYSWRVYAAQIASEYDPNVRIREALCIKGTDRINTDQSFGIAGVYMDERTFAHAVMDIINNF